ncbi:hypothetical protein [Cardiobacterium hominis]|jgi:hypothetical protein|uniref:hypothetical protein n=1 Tax=Cardiobacterium hominis TaxID=2718 RepID=UPI0028D69461|nr:hypothetical protein [Cardiobacterium hominis]
MKELTINEVKEVSGGWELRHGAALGGAIGAGIGAAVGTGLGGWSLGFTVGGLTYVGTYAGSIFDNGPEVRDWIKDENTFLNRYGRSWSGRVMDRYNRGLEIY